MTFKRASVILSLLWVGWSLTAAAVPPAATQASAADKTPKRLVRLDLLVPQERSLKPERRNIFSAGSAGAEADVPLQRRNGRNRRPVPDADKEEAQPENTTSVIQYIGYVHSPRGIIGLLLIDGTTRALADGDPVRPGLKVTKISLKEVEVESADGAKTIYSLKGAEK